jgi:hypothetical protein
MLVPFYWMALRARWSDTATIISTSSRSEPHSAATDKTGEQVPELSLPTLRQLYAFRYRNSAILGSFGGFLLDLVDRQPLQKETGVNQCNPSFWDSCRR